MTWQQYYDQFYDWADSTQVSRISSISDFSGAKTEEIIEAALSFADEGPATRLIKRALEGGVRFSAEDVLEVLAWVREDFRADFAEKAVTPFAEEDMDALRTLLPEKTVRCWRGAAALCWTVKAASPHRDMPLPSGKSRGLGPGEHCLRPLELSAEVRAERGMEADAAATVPSVRLITVTAMAAGMMAAIMCMAVNSAGTVIPEKRKEESGAKSAKEGFP